MNTLYFKYLRIKKIIDPYVFENTLVIRWSVFLILIISILLWVWLPIVNKINIKKLEINDNRALLNSIIQTKKDVVAENVAITQNTNSLFDIINSRLNEDNFADYLVHKNISKNAAGLTFSDISFDSLVLWLERLWKLDYVEIEKINIESATSPGLVNADLVLKKIVNSSSLPTAQEKRI